MTDVERFERELPERFDNFPGSKEPRDPRFAEILEAVPGLAKPNNLALVNLAAACLDPGESYLEAGSFRGTSLIAAMLGNEGDFVGIDDFSMGDGSREQLETNLGNFGLSDVTILEGDALDTLRGDALGGRRVGVFYYDAGHSYEEHIEALRAVEPHLADCALLIVDDSDWTQVTAAIEDYLAEQPSGQRLLSLPGKDKGSPAWWFGVDMLRYDARPAR